METARLSGCVDPFDGAWNVNDDGFWMVFEVYPMTYGVVWAGKMIQGLECLWESSGL